MKSRLSRLGCLVLLLAGGSAIAGDADPQEILGRMFAALGGREAIGELRSLAVDAECTGPGGNFRTRVDSFLPGSVHFTQSSDDRTTEIWSTAERTWRADADAGTRDLDEGVRQFIRAHEFHLLLFELESRFTNHRLGELRRMLGQDCRSILMEDQAGQPASVCVAERNSLPLVLEMNPKDAEGPLRITFDDWRRVEGLHYFFSFTLAEGPGRTFTYAYRTVTPDSVPAELFVPRAGSRERSDQEAILKILRDDRQAHLKTDASLLASHLADTLIEISNGEVYTRTRPEVEAMFEQYFKGADYRMWEDSRPPQIRLSQDLTMAWVARSVRARRESPDPQGDTVTGEFSSAYTSTYEKSGGAWKMTSVTSTFARR